MNHLDKKRSFPLKHLRTGVGSVAVAVWFGLITAPNLLLSIIGNGCPERWVAYPTMLWPTGFGGYLMHEITASGSRP